MRSPSGRNPADLKKSTRRAFAGRFHRVGHRPQLNPSLITKARCQSTRSWLWIFKLRGAHGWMGALTPVERPRPARREAASAGLLAYPALDGRRHPDLSRDPMWPCWRGSEANTFELTRDILQASSTMITGSISSPLTGTGYRRGATRVSPCADGSKKIVEISTPRDAAAST